MPDAPVSAPTPTVPAGPELFRLDGSVALITGAAGEFGRAASLGLARAGAELLLTDVKEARLQETADAVRALGGKVETAVADVAVAEEVAAVFDRLDAVYGRMDVLLNNAGINPRQDRPEDLAVEIWETVIRTNLTGYLLFAQHAARRMIGAGRGGSIINISSIAASSALGRGNFAFGVSKAGVDQMTRELAVEWAHHGIRVNAIQPAQFLNDGLRAWLADPAQATVHARMLAGLPVGRMGQADELVGPILFLASQASTMVTGIVLRVDGGNGALNPGGSLPAPTLQEGHV